MNAPMIPYEDYVGKKFGRLTILRYTPGKRDRAKGISIKGKYLCLCDCGNKIEPDAYGVIHGYSTSCRCSNSRLMKALSTKHGMHGTTEYWTWLSMKNRCRNKNEVSYPNYGGRGISVCERWQDFKYFIEDMGLRPAGKYSIERIDNDGNYEPSNCKWATRKEQALNTRQHQKASTDTNCAICGIAINRRARDYAPGKNYCGACAHIGRRKGKEIKCGVCEKNMWIMPYQFEIKKYCSRKCVGISQRRRK